MAEKANSIKILLDTLFGDDDALAKLAECVKKNCGKGGKAFNTWYVKMNRIRSRVANTKNRDALLKEIVLEFDKLLSTGYDRKLVECMLTSCEAEYLEHASTSMEKVDKLSSIIIRMFQAMSKKPMKDGNVDSSPDRREMTLKVLNVFLMTVREIKESSKSMIARPGINDIAKCAKKNIGDSGLSDYVRCLGASAVKLEKIEKTIASLTLKSQPRDIAKAWNSTMTTLLESMECQNSYAKLLSNKAFMTKLLHACKNEMVAFQVEEIIAAKKTLRKATKNI